MFDLFKTKNRSVIGVSYDEGVVRYAHVVFEDSGFLHVKDHGQIPLFFSHNIQDVDDMVQALEPLRAFQKSPLVVALHDGDIHVHNVALPSFTQAYDVLTDQKKVRGTPVITQKHIQSYIEQGIVAHLSETTSFNPAHYVIEYEIVQETPAGYRVLVTLYQERILTLYKALFARLGFSMVSFEASTPLVARLHMNHYQALTLVRIGTHDTLVSRLDNGSVTEKRHIPFGKETLIQIIRGYLNCDKEQARSILNDFGMTKAHRDKGLLYAIELHGTLLVQAIQEIASQDNPCVVYGEGAYIDGITEYIQQETRTSTRFLHVWRLFPNHETSVPKVDWYDSLRFAPAIAVAVDALRGEFGV